MTKHIDYGSYRSSEIARYYGMTNKGLQFYEDKGILTPERAENGKYRVFHLDDCYTIYQAKLLRRCGFSVDDTMQLIDRSDERAYRERMLKRKKEVEKEVKAMERVAFHMDEVCALLADLDGRCGRYEEALRPPMLRLFVRTYASPHECSQEEAEEFALWNNWLPVNRASLLFPREAALSGTEAIDTGIGNIMLEPDFALLGFPRSSRVTFYPQARCIYTVVSGDPQNMSDPRWLSGAMAHLEERGLALRGDILTRYIGIFDRPGGQRRFDEAWLPV